MSDLEKLTRYFERFPGVGARQARRFAYHVLTLPETDTTELSTLIKQVQGSVRECVSCRRFFVAHSPTEATCAICCDTRRDRQKLLIVATDNDLTAIERSNVYDGLYFVLGGTLPLLSEPETKRLRANGLLRIVEERLTAGTLQEIILGFPVNPDGENTARFVRSQLQPILETTTITISELGRGLSTGSELEYADTETIKSALQNRLQSLRDS